MTVFLKSFFDVKEVFVGLLKGVLPGLGLTANLDEKIMGVCLLDLLEGMDAVLLVDAVQAASPPGTLLRLGMEELAAFTPGSASAHGWGVAETLQVGFSLYPWLADMQVVLIGIVGENFDLGEGLSAGVNAALDDAVMAIETEARKLLAMEE